MLRPLQRLAFVLNLGMTLDGSPMLGFAAAGTVVNAAGLFADQVAERSTL